MAVATEDWDFFICERGGFDASIVVNLALQTAGLDARRPWQLSVRVKMLKPAANGLTTSEERPTLNQIDEALRATILSACDAVFVGRTVRAGNWTFTYYGANPGELPTAAARAMSNFTKYTFTQLSKEDAQWSAYRTLLPSDREMLQITNRRRVDRMRRKGDDLRGSREVSHTLYFNTGRDRKSFIAAVADENYVASESMLPTEGREQKCFAVRLSRTDFADYHSIHELALSLFDNAHMFHGEYEGWASAIVKTVQQ